MIKCPHCGKSLSPLIRVCPYCGKEMPAKKAAQNEYVLQYEEMDSGLTDPNRIRHKNAVIVWLCVLGAIGLFFLLLILFADSASALPYVPAHVRAFLRLL
ncbi:MAG: zinc ribbon domain-containing protein [Clostridia bacterium]|nr:zinc ribbon domain-containing protein [Clostridia bacterium]